MTMRTFYKILHTTCKPGWGDIEQKIYNELAWMKDQGHNMILVCPKESPLFVKAKENGIKVFGIDFKPFSFFKNYKLLKNFLYNEKPDVLHTHGKSDTAMAQYSARKLKIPLRLLSYHNDYRVKKTLWNRIIFKSCCHYIFTPSRFTTGYLQKLFKLKEMKVFTLPAGIIPPDILSEANTAREAFAGALGLDPGARFIGVSGLPGKGKALNALLEAFQTVKARLPGHHLVISGTLETDAAHAVMTLSKGLKIEDAVHFVESWKDPWLFYRAMSCFILTQMDIKQTDVVQKRQALLCAMLSETPVLGPKTELAADLLTHEKTGLIYDEMNFSDLAGKLVHTLQNEDSVKDRVEAAKNFAAKHHTIDTLGRDIIRIYSLHQIRRNRPSFQD